MSSWQSRTAVLLILLVAMAGAVFMMQKSASAALPQISTSYSDTAGPVAPGAAVQFIVTVTTNDETNAGSEGLTIEVTVDTANLMSVVASCSTVGFGGSVTATGPEYRCSWYTPSSGAEMAGDYILTIDAFAGGGTSIAALSDVKVCHNDSTNCGSVTHQDISTSGTIAIQSSQPAVAELRHINEDGDSNTQQDIENNVVGYRHTVCLFDSDDPDRDFTVPLSIGDINVVPGGGYSTIGDPDPTFTDPEIFTGSKGHSEGNTCFSWISTEAGDQEINVEYQGDDGAFYQVDWDTNDSGSNPGGNNAIIKEWNVLQHSCIGLTGGAVFSYDHSSGPGVGCGYDDDAASPTVDVTIGSVFDPSLGSYIFAPIAVDDIFMGSHVDRTDSVFHGALVGVTWTAKIASASDCGAVNGGSGTTRQGHEAAQFTIVDNSDCNLGDEIHVEISGREPGPQGSGDGEIVDQYIIIRLDTPVAHKHVFLAWAGQRIALSADYGVLPGDDGANCYFSANTTTSWIKGSGPGNFLPTSDPDITKVEGSDFAEGYVSNSTNLSLVIGDNCISSVLYKSEDQGQVDIETFVTDANYTKQAFVIYYMKIEDVKVSLVTSQTNEDHNGSSALWVPGNPWDATTDVTSADWNVSEDILVRIRVRGWFTNSNPSGRAADDSNPQNHLPPNRWVMPDDWPNLAGGALAIDFRPEYDIMIAPNNALTLLCESDHGRVCSETAPVSTTTGLPVQGGEIGNVVGPYSVLDVPGNNTAAPGSGGHNPRNTIVRDVVIDWYDAPMPAAPVYVGLTGTGWLKPVSKLNVYHDNAKVPQLTNPFYSIEIPDSPMIPAVVIGGGYFWDSFGGDGPYDFWTPLAAPSNGADLVLYSDNHGEVMVVANGDLGVTYDDCSLNPFGGWHCGLGDKVGTATIDAVADYPDFRGKHFPVASNEVTVDWTWGGYKGVTVEDGETEQFKYVVLHVVDRDGFCSASPSLHPVYGEYVEFLIDGGEGKIINAAYGGELSGERGAADDVMTFSTAVENAKTGGIKTFDHMDVGQVFADECQAWVRISSSLLDLVDVLIIADDPEGYVAFDVQINFTPTADYTLNFRWSLITWAGEDGVSPSAALAGGSPDITAGVTAIYGWEGASQTWLGFFPAGVGVPGANDLGTLTLGQAYWIAITGPDSITWTVTTNVN